MQEKKPNAQIAQYMIIEQYLAEKHIAHKHINFINFFSAKWDLIVDCVNE